MGRLLISVAVGVSDLGVSFTSASSTQRDSAHAGRQHGDDGTRAAHPVDDRSPSADPDFEGQCNRRPMPPAPLVALAPLGFTAFIFTSIRSGSLVNFGGVALPFRC